jgi:hypothetical protein
VLENDPLLFGLWSAFIVSFLMTVSTRLAQSTRLKTALLCLFWAVSLGTLYNPDICKMASDLLSGQVTCQNIVMMRDDIAANYLGTDYAGVLSTMSLFVSVTIGLSGTRSGKWKFLAGLLFALSVLAFIFRYILPRIG